MDILNSNVISRFKPYFLIMDKENEIVFISKKLKEILKRDNTINLKNELNKSSIKIDIDGKNYNIDRIKIEGYDNAILLLDEGDNFYDYETKYYCLEQIIENLYDGVLLSDKDGKVVIYNDSMEEIEA